MISRDKKIFIGGAWPYANNSLHVGHLAALLPGDVIARFFRLNGNEVIYVSGTDCHGTPITERAKREGVSPYDIALSYHKEFSKNFNDLDFSYDMYTATFEEYHKSEVQKMILRMYEKGYFYVREEEQDYCEYCECALSDREVIGECPNCGSVAKGDQCDACLSSFDSKELENKRCIYCGNDTSIRKTKHLVFLLSKFQSVLESLKKNNGDNWRCNAVNETDKYLKQGLPDRTATRAIDWGIEIPIEEVKDKRLYVWFDAVLGYLTTGKRVAEERGISFSEFIKDDSVESYYIHGKDNIPFHTVIFPALILALEENIQLPKHIISSEYINFNDEKMSKSKGNFKSLNDLLNQFQSDMLRFYILYISPEKKDANFSIENMIQMYNKFLCGGFGNFVNRNLSFVMKKFEGKLPMGKVDSEVVKYVCGLYEEFATYISQGDMRKYLTGIIDFIQYANKYYDDSMPWIYAKNDLAKFYNITSTCVFIMANMINLFLPALPNGTEKLAKMLGITEKKWEVSFYNRELVLDYVEVLYDKVDDKILEN